MRALRLVLLATALIVPLAARADAPLRLRIGWVVVPGHLFPDVKSHADLSLLEDAARRPR